MSTNTKISKELEEEWNKKLKESGFEDIEQPDGKLKLWHSHYFGKALTDPITAKAKEEYYTMAAEFLDTYSFASPEEKHIWEMHASGKTVSEIYRHLKDTDRKMYRDGIIKLVKRLADTMVTGWRPKEN